MKVEWRREASRDLQTAFAYLFENGPSAAYRFLETVEEAIDLIGRFPHAGRMAENGETRELVLSRYAFILAYAIANERIVILRVFHAAMRR